MKQPVEETKKKSSAEKEKEKDKEKEGKRGKLFLKDKETRKENKRLLINSLSLTSGTYPKEEGIVRTQQRA